MLVEHVSDDGPLAMSSKRVIQDERNWFLAPAQPNAVGPEAALAVSRWSGFAQAPQEVVTEIKPESYVLAIALRPMDLTVFTARKLIHDGRMQQGIMRVNEPGCPMRGIFRGRYDALHVHIPKAMVEEFTGLNGDTPDAASLVLNSDQLVVDPVVERLAQAMMRADDISGGFGKPYADGIGLALVARLLARNSGTDPQLAKARVSGLPKWRLKRAIDYMAANLGDPISLADIAASTGLTRMHFATQFRVSTGLRPHEYLLRRRIERAQERLATSPTPLIEVALEVGFSTQAHFTTVFTRFVGETPGVWRRNHTMVPTAPVRTRRCTTPRASDRRCPRVAAMHVAG